MKKQKSLLIIEDNRALSIAVAALAERCQLLPTAVPTMVRARHAINRQQTTTGQPFDFVLLDIGLPDGNGLELLENGTILPSSHTAIISAHGDIENAIAARKLGAIHFFNKPVDFDSLERFFTEYSQDRQPSDSPEQHSNENPNDPVSPPLIGSTEPMLGVFQHIAQACTNTDPVIIRGEAGTGKSHVARLVQAHTTPHKNPTFTASPQTKPEEIATLLIQNPSSTLLVENLTSLPQVCQQQLLITLDSLQTQAPRLLVTVDEEGLHQHTQANHILPELYYRLQVLEIHLPPLRERTEDIPALTSYFLGELDHTRSRELSPELLTTLQEYPWPGNLRELRNLISYLVHSHTESRVLQPGQLPRHFSEQKNQTPKDPLTICLSDWVSRHFDNPDISPSYKDIHRKLENRLLAILMDRFDQKPSRLAKNLHMNRSTLRKKLSEM